MARRFVAPLTLLLALCVAGSPPARATTTFVGANALTTSAQKVKGVWYVSTSASVTDHGDPAQVGSAAWCAASLAGNPGTLEFPPNKTYVFGTNWTPASTLTLVLRRGAVLSASGGVTVNRASCVTVTEAPTYTAGAGTHTGGVTLGPGLNVTTATVGTLTAGSVTVGDVVASGPVVDVRSYLPAGYVSDGSVDYTTYARSAIAAIAARGGGVLLIPAAFTLGLDYQNDGKCALDLSGTSNIIIRGMGPSSVLKKRTELVNNPPGLLGIYDTTAGSGAVWSGFRVENLTIDMGRATKTAFDGAYDNTAGIFFSSTNNTIRNVAVSDVVVHDSTGDLVYFGAGCQGVRVTGCSGYNYLRSGITVTGGSGYVLAGNTELASTAGLTVNGTFLHVEPSAGLRASDITITGNASLNGIAVTRTDRLSVTGNVSRGAYGNPAYGEWACSGQTVTGNTFDASSETIPAAVEIAYPMGTTRGIIAANRVIGGAGGGLEIYRATDATLLTETVGANDPNPQTGESWTVADNEITATGAGKGIYTYLIGNVAIRGGSVATDTGDTIKLEETLGATIRGVRATSASASPAVQLKAASTKRGYRSLCAVTDTFFDTGGTKALGVYGVSAIVRGNELGGGAVEVLAGGRLWPWSDGDAQVLRLTDNTLPVYGVWTTGDHVLYGTPVAGGAPGQVCVTAGGQYSDTWAATTAYAKGDYVKALTGTKILEVTNTGGGTSGGAEPTWPGAVGGTVTDGTITWTLRATTAAAWKPMASLAP